MKELLNYNFNPDDIEDEDYNLLFTRRRRDSTFAFVYEKNGNYYAIRDHLGIVPLYYRYEGEQFKFSTNLSDLIAQNDAIDKMGLQYLLAFGTPRLYPLIKGIDIIPPGSAVKLDKSTGEKQILFQYKIKPAQISRLKSMDSIVQQVDALFHNAVKRLVKFDRVGLYFSGGMDSSLIGIALRRLGLQINAYTSSSAGINSDGAIISRKNARFIGVQSHHIDTLEVERNPEMLSRVAQIYGLPHGTTVGLGITNLWTTTPICQEKQVFFGQNSDTMTCSVGIQVRMCLRHFLPGFVRKHLKVHYHNKEYELPDDDILNNYVYLRSNGWVNHYPLIHSICDLATLTNYQRMTIAGMYYGHTPKDSEDMTQPAIKNNIIISNPFYDMDLIEYNLGIPMQHRLSLMIYPRKKLKFLMIKPIFRKRVLEKVALKHLPKELVHKKRGFSVPLAKNNGFEDTENLPTTLLGIALDNAESEVTAGVFRSWCDLHGIRIDKDEPYYADA